LNPQKINICHLNCHQGIQQKALVNPWKFVISLWIDHTSLYGSQPAIVFPYTISTSTLFCLVCMHGRNIAGSSSNDLDSLFLHQSHLLCYQYRVFDHKRDRHTIVVYFFIIANLKPAFFYIVSRIAEEEVYP